MIEEIKPIKHACYRCKEIKLDVQERIDPTDNCLKFICDWCNTILSEDAVTQYDPNE